MDSYRAKDIQELFRLDKRRSFLTFIELLLTSPTNGATLTGAGIGLAWAGPQQWSAKTSLAARIGAVPVLITDPSSVRLWVEVNKAF